MCVLAGGGTAASSGGTGAAGAWQLPTTGPPPLPPTATLSQHHAPPIRAQSGGAEGTGSWSRTGCRAPHPETELAPRSSSSRSGGRVRCGRSDRSLARPSSTPVAPVRPDPNTHMRQLRQPRAGSDRLSCHNASRAPIDLRWCRAGLQRDLPLRRPTSFLASVTVDACPAGAVFVRPSVRCPFVRCPSVRCPILSVVRPSVVHMIVHPGGGGGGMDGRKDREVAIPSLRRKVRPLGQRRTSLSLAAIQLSSIFLPLPSEMSLRGGQRRRRRRWSRKCWRGNGAAGPGGQEVCARRPAGCRQARKSVLQRRPHLQPPARCSVSPSGRHRPVT